MGQAMQRAPERADTALVTPVDAAAALLRALAGGEPMALGAACVQAPRERGCPLVWIKVAPEFDAVMNAATARAVAWRVAEAGRFDEYGLDRDAVALQLLAAADDADDLAEKH